MISKYRKISIIYGTRGKKCALAIESLFNSKHTCDIYPIKSYLLAKEILNSENIVSTIKAIISESDVCIILLTFDDIRNTRVRQNILIELGMAMVLLDSSKIYYLSEKVPLPDDFPTDLKYAINPNLFNPQADNQTSERVVSTITTEIGVESYKDILTNNNYIYDYREIVWELPSSIYELEAEPQMKRILSEWTSSLQSFDYAAERIMYILERCIFLPLFIFNDSLSDFFTVVFRYICPTTIDYKCFDAQQINDIYLLADNVLKYIELKLRFVSEARKSATQSTWNHHWYNSFSSIADELELLSTKIENNVLKVNWYLAILAFDYAGLSRMQAVKLGQLSKSAYEDHLMNANRLFEKVNVLTRQYCFHSRYLWEGYTQYNISRIFELLYERDKKEEYMQNIRVASAAAIKARRRIVDNSVHLKGIFSIALTNEYFQALYHEYLLEFKWPEFSEGDLNDIAKKIMTALAEINIFCDSTGLKQLYDMRESLQSLLARTKALSED